MRRFVLLAGLVFTLIPTLAAAADLPLERIKLPPGFSIDLWTRIDNPRQMTLGRHDEGGGTLFVGSMRAGKVHAVRFGADFRAQQVREIASGLQ